MSISLVKNNKPIGHASVCVLLRVVWEFDVIYFWFFYAKTTRHPFWYNLFLVFLVHSLRSKNTWTILKIFFSPLEKLKKRWLLVMRIRNICPLHHSSYCLRGTEHKLLFSRAELLQWKSLHLCNPDITTLLVTQLRCGANDNLSLLILSRLLLSRDADLRSENHYLNYYHYLLLLCGNWFNCSIYLIRQLSSQALTPLPG